MERRRPKSRLWRSILRWGLLALVAFYGLAILCLIALRWVGPSTTAVQAERRIESWMHKGHYQKRYVFVPLDRISPDFRHAVIAAEDARFYLHHGFDWHEVENAIDEELDEGHMRGASTLTQQLVKNLFLGTSRSMVRKAVEATLVPPAEAILGKRRILELYLNVVEWGPGFYGAEAAARNYYKLPAARIGREEGARLAAILPAPLRRKPVRMTRYSAVILHRMNTMGW